MAARRRRPGRRWADLDARPPRRPGTRLALGLRRRSHGRPRAAVRPRRGLPGGDACTPAHPPGAQRPEVVGMTAPLGPEQASEHLRTLPAPALSPPTTWDIPSVQPPCCPRSTAPSSVASLPGHSTRHKRPRAQPRPTTRAAWHRSTKARNGRRLIWSDRFDAATPHDPHTAPRPSLEQARPMFALPTLLSPPLRACRTECRRTERYGAHLGVRQGLSGADPAARCNAPYEDLQTPASGSSTSSRIRHCATTRPRARHDPH